MYKILAKIIKGEGRGKKIGFPTINLDPVNIKIDHGVYLVMAEIGEKEYKALFFFGPKKTFGDNISAEIFIKNYLDVLPKNVIIKVIKKIRDVRKFESVRELQNQIKKDIESVNNIN